MSSSTCELCEMDPAVWRCVECARDEFGLLCDGCNTSMHTKKAAHQRTRIQGAAVTAPPAAPAPATPAKHSAASHSLAAAASPVIAAVSASPGGLGSLRNSALAASLTVGVSSLRGGSPFAAGLGSLRNGATLGANLGLGSFHAPPSPSPAASPGSQSAGLGVPRGSFSLAALAQMSPGGPSPQHSPPPQYSPGFGSLRGHASMAVTSLALGGLGPGSRSPAPGSAVRPSLLRPQSAGASHALQQISPPAQRRTVPHAPIPPSVAITTTPAPAASARKASMDDLAHTYPTSGGGLVSVPLCDVCEAAEACTFCDSCSRDASCEHTHYCAACEQEWHGARQLLHSHTRFPMDKMHNELYPKEKHMPTDANSSSNSSPLPPTHPLVHATSSPSPTQAPRTLAVAPPGKASLAHGSATLSLTGSGRSVPHSPMFLSSADAPLRPPTAALAAAAAATAAPASSVPNSLLSSPSLSAIDERQRLNVSDSTGDLDGIMEGLDSLDATPLAGRSRRDTNEGEGQQEGRTEAVAKQAQTPATPTLRTRATVGTVASPAPLMSGATASASPSLSASPSASPSLKYRDSGTPVRAGGGGVVPRSPAVSSISLHSLSRRPSRIRVTAASAAASAMEPFVLSRPPSLTHSTSLLPSPLPSPPSTTTSDAPVTTEDPSQSAQQSTPGAGPTAAASTGSTSKPTSPPRPPPLLSLVATPILAPTTETSSEPHVLPTATHASVDAPPTSQDTPAPALAPAPAPASGPVAPLADSSSPVVPGSREAPPPNPAGSVAPSDSATASTTPAEAAKGSSDPELVVSLKEMSAEAATSTQSTSTSGALLDAPPPSYLALSIDTTTPLTGSLAPSPLLAASSAQGSTLSTPSVSRELSVVPHANGASSPAAAKHAAVVAETPVVAEATMTAESAAPSPVTATNTSDAEANIAVAVASETSSAASGPLSSAVDASRDDGAKDELAAQEMSPLPLRRGLTHVVDSSAARTHRRSSGGRNVAAATAAVAHVEQRVELKQEEAGAAVPGEKGVADVSTVSSAAEVAPPLTTAPSAPTVAAVVPAASPRSTVLAAAAAPLRLCELCDDEVAAVHCASCAMDLCIVGKCDRSLHMHARNVTHVRTPIRHDTPASNPGLGVPEQTTTDSAGTVAETVPVPALVEATPSPPPPSSPGVVQKLERAASELAAQERAQEEEEHAERARQAQQQQQAQMREEEELARAKQVELEEKRKREEEDAVAAAAATAAAAAKAEQAALERERDERRAAEQREREERAATEREQAAQLARAERERADQEAREKATIQRMAEEARVKAQTEAREREAMEAAAAAEDAKAKAEVEEKKNAAASAAAAKAQEEEAASQAAAFAAAAALAALEEERQRKAEQAEQQASAAAASATVAAAAQDAERQRHAEEQAAKDRAHATTVERERLEHDRRVRDHRDSSDAEERKEQQSPVFMQTHTSAISPQAHQCNTHNVQRILEDTSAPQQAQPLLQQTAETSPTCKEEAPEGKAQVTQMQTQERQVLSLQVQQPSPHLPHPSEQPPTHQHATHPMPSASSNGHVEPHCQPQQKQQPSADASQVPPAPAPPTSAAPTQPLPPAPPSLLLPFPMPPLPPGLLPPWLEAERAQQHALLQQHLSRSARMEEMLQEQQGVIEALRAQQKEKEQEQQRKPQEQLQHDVNAPHQPRSYAHGDPRRFRREGQAHHEKQRTGPWMEEKEQSCDETQPSAPIIGDAPNGRHASLNSGCDSGTSLASSDARRTEPSDSFNEVRRHVRPSRPASARPVRSFGRSGAKRKDGDTDEDDSTARSYAALRDRQLRSSGSPPDVDRTAQEALLASLSMGLGIGPNGVFQPLAPSSDSNTSPMTIADAAATHAYFRSLAEDAMDPSSATAAQSAGLLRATLDARAAATTMGSTTIIRPCKPLSRRPASASVIQGRLVERNGSAAVVEPRHTSHTSQLLVGTMLPSTGSVRGRHGRTARAFSSVAPPPSTLPLAWQVGSTGHPPAAPPSDSTESLRHAAARSRRLLSANAYLSLPRALLHAEFDNVGRLFERQQAALMARHARADHARASSTEGQLQESESLVPSDEETASEVGARASTPTSSNNSRSRSSRSSTSRARKYEAKLQRSAEMASAVQAAQVAQAQVHALQQQVATQAHQLAYTARGGAYYSPSPPPPYALATTLPSLMHSEAAAQHAASTAYWSSLAQQQQQQQQQPSFLSPRPPAAPFVPFPPSHPSSMSAEGASPYTSSASPVSLQQPLPWPLPPHAPYPPHSQVPQQH